MVHSYTTYMYLFKYHDGGRSASFDTKGVNDCVTRSLAILTGLPYLEVWNGVRATGTVGRTGLVDCRDWRFKKYANSLGLIYVPVNEMMKQVALPSKCVVEIRGHMFAVIDGVMLDEGPHSQSGRTNVRGYWMHKPKDMFNVCCTVTGTAQNRAPLNYEQAQTMARLLMLNYKKQSNICTI